MVGAMSRSDKRSYDSPLREAQTAETRRRILQAAAEELVRFGYAKASVAGIATTAGVSRETVYHLVGGKAALLKAVYDVAVVGGSGPHLGRPDVRPAVRRARRADRAGAAHPR
jgi:AcrR family transcriptional regulator